MADIECQKRDKLKQKKCLFKKCKPNLIWQLLLATLPTLLSVWSAFHHSL